MLKTADLLFPRLEEKLGLKFDLVTRATTAFKSRTYFSTRRRGKGETRPWRPKFRAARRQMEEEGSGGRDRNLNPEVIILIGSN